MKRTTLFLLLFWSLAVCPGHTQQPGSAPPDAVSSTQTQASSPDLDAIRAGSEAFVAAFNEQDAKAIAAMWTEDGEYVDESGRRFAGRQAIETAYARFFADNPDAEMEITIDALRLVGRNVALEEGRAVVEPAAAAAAGVSRYTAVHAKVDGQWLMAAVRDRRLQAPAAVRSAADLDWLIGAWKAEEHGVQIESVSRWVADGCFIERRYTTTELDGTKTTGVQLIGWNPQGGHVQSWDFSPDGGHAIGVWTPTDGGWRARVRGVTGAGLPTEAVNWLIRLDDNAYVWQSLRRYLGDVALPDTDQVVIKRQRDKAASPKG
jgi:uncharacterized protein (TIGR02246 family)